jgi:hypothetical protein
MDLRRLPRIVISMAVTLAFLAALSSSDVSASKAHFYGTQGIAAATRAFSQAPSEVSKTMPATPEVAGGMTTPPRIRIDNPVTCYSTCVIGCNPRQEAPARPCQKRCASHCWKE